MYEDPTLRKVSSFTAILTYRINDHEMVGKPPLVSRLT